MKIYNHRVELIIDPPSIMAKNKSTSNLRKQLKEAGVTVEDITSKSAKLPKAKTTSKAFPGKQSEKIYVKTGIRDSEMNPWDVAHASSKAIGAQTTFIEPDLLHEFYVDTNTNAAYKRNGAKAMTKAVAKADDNGYDPDWYPKKNIIWHLNDDFSQLKKAREAITGNEYVVRIGHLDTGYDPTHTIIPASAKANKLQRNFVDGENEMDAHDPRLQGLTRMPGHGTGTLGILAGNKIRLNTDDGIFHDYLGGAPFAEVICCRISPTVILIKTSAFAEAINYLVGLTHNGTPVHVVSMSMGGAPSRAWTQSINAAYEAGITLVTAAGNNFNGVPTTHVIYPARFERVIAACGVTYKFQPYHSTKFKEMQGCYGPEKHMDKALSAFTPNMPWARGNASVISFSGAGTSAATPQIAAAVAIYYRKYHAQLDALPGWQRVEAIRNALYRSAAKNGIPYPGDTFKKSFGNGILKAFDALQEPVMIINDKAPEAKMPWFPILNTIFKAVPKPNVQPRNQVQMFNTELAQLVYYYPDLAKLIGNDEKPYDKVSEKQWKKFKDAVIQHPGTSLTLKKYLMSTNF